MKVRKDPTASDNEIIEIKLNSLRPGRILALLPVNVITTKAPVLEGPRQLGP